MKENFEARLKMTEGQWRQRLKCHKDMLNKERMKNTEMEVIIKQLVSKVAHLEQELKLKERFPESLENGVQTDIDVKDRFRLVQKMIKESIVDSSDDDYSKTLNSSYEID